MKKLKIIMLVISFVPFILHLSFFGFALYESANQDYLYCTVDIPVFVYSLILSLFLPLGGLLCCVFALKGNQKGKLSKTIILILSVVLIIFNSISLPVSFYTVVWGDAGFASSTEDFADYGLYDSCVINTLQHFSVENILPPKSQISADSEYRYYANSYTGKKHTSDEENATGDSVKIFSEYFKIELHAVFLNHEYFQQAVEKLENQQKKLEALTNRLNILWSIDSEQNIIDYAIEYVY